MKRFIKFLLITLSLCLVALAITSCGGTGPDEPSSQGGSSDDADYTNLTFKDALSYEYLKELEGEKVAINGYLATSSPVDGSFIFLMNMPYQSCPFCVPNTTEARRRWVGVGT